jgi:ABC-type sugar transport system substrate-binding protein
MKIACLIQDTCWVEFRLRRRGRHCILAPLDDTALKRPVSAAMAKGIPVVIMDSALKGEPGKDFVSTVSTNNYHGGEMAGEELGKRLGEKARWCFFAP